MSNKDSNFHSKEHRSWSRRQFLMTGGLASMSSLLLGNSVVQSVASSSILNAVNQADTDRVIVFLNLFGGNDGLNTVVPISDNVGRSVYEEYRPILKRVLGNAAHNYSSNTTLNNFGSSDFALPNSMSAAMDMWNNNDMAILHNVGYPNQNLSHFISTQIWQTGADSAFDDRFKSGVVGRQMETEFPAFSTAPPVIPPAIQVGNFSNHIFNGQDETMGLIFGSPESFYNIAKDGKLYSTDHLDDCPQGDSNSFVREIANNSNRYSKSIFEAANRGQNCGSSNYAETNVNRTSLQSQLSIIARLIKGNLGTKVYSAYGKGYDTHSAQSGSQTALVGEVATNVTAFFDDLKECNLDDKVTLVVFSEFGRTIIENTSLGTDHGNLAPVMIFGGGINGGFYNDPTDLSKVEFNRVTFESQDKPLDFRSIFATLFEQWLCIPPLLVNYILGDNYPRIDGLITDPCINESLFDKAVLLGHHAGDDPHEVSIKYAIPNEGVVQLRLMDKSGQELTIFFKETKTAGSHVFTFNTEECLLSSGEYIYQLDAGGKEYQKPLIIK